MALMQQYLSKTPHIVTLYILPYMGSSPYRAFEGKDFYPTIEEKAACQAYGIIRNHPFLDGNKRTGLFVILVFLELNSIKLYFSQSEQVELGIGIAEGKTDSEQIIKWII
ncbi:MAG: type II toxin-antitoxin system death-on-curing family toxin [Candidatus Humimicrobiaceae bacterium]